VQRFIYILFLIVPSVCIAQIKSIGVLSIRNYQKFTYQAGAQNWGISQDQNGFMYFTTKMDFLASMDYYGV
jgi:hypothetical protein